MGLKNNHPSAVNFFYPWLEDLFENLYADLIIVDVPSHDPKKKSSGIKTLINKLSKNHPHITDWTGEIERTKLIKKLSYGGNRDVDFLMSTISISLPEYFKNQNILIIDDVLTSGSSMVAAHNLLVSKSRPESVLMLTLVKTAKYDSPASQKKEDRRAERTTEPTEVEEYFF